MRSSVWIAVHSRRFHSIFRHIITALYTLCFLLLLFYFFLYIFCILRYHGHSFHNFPLISLNSAFLNHSFLPNFRICPIFTRFRHISLDSPKFYSPLLVSASIRPLLVSASIRALLLLCHPIPINSFRFRDRGNLPSRLLCFLHLIPELNNRCTGGPPFPRWFIRHHRRSYGHLASWTVHLFTQNSQHSIRR